MKRFFVGALAALLLASPALAQIGGGSSNPGVITQGTTTPNNCVKFGSTRNRIQDAGGPCLTSAVSSFNGRTGAVVPAASDYSFAQISGTLTPATQLPASGASAGTFGSATQCVSLTVTAQGIVTAASAVTCTPAFTSLTGSIAIGQIPNGLITYAKLQNESGNTVLGSLAGGTPPAELPVPSCSTALNGLTWTSGVGFGCNTFGSTGAIIAPQGRLTLQSGASVMTTTQANKTTIFYDCYNGNSVPYYDGVSDKTEAIASCEVSNILISTGGAGTVLVNNVFDIFWVHGGANRICAAQSAGTGWAGDTGGSNTARGTGYSAIDNSRGYLTNTNSITNCWNNATQYGPVAPHQGTYLGTFYTTANGQTSFVFGSNATGGGQAASLYLWNAYNRVPVKTSVSDSVNFWTITDGNVHSYNNDAGTRLNFVTGLAQDSVGVALYDQICNVTNPNNPIMAIGFALDRSGNTTFDKIAIQYMNSASVAQTGQVCGSLSVNSTYNNLLGVHFIQALANQDGQATAWTGQYYGGIRTSFDGYFNY